MINLFFYYNKKVPLVYAKSMKNFLLLLFTIASYASDWNSFTYYPEMATFYHPVSTDCQEAQEAFNEGLLAIYAFNVTQAQESFQKVTELDPELAIGYWGLALSLKKDPKRLDEAKALIEKAKSLTKATANEKAYIEALWFKYNKDPKAYMEAMQKVALAFADDPDAQTLYAESMMDIMHWESWTYDKKPREYTEKVIAVLQTILKSVPMHPGANHYFLHAVEDSPNPEKGLVSAERLDGTFPEWGHLLHTPTHIYIRVGEYEKSIMCNLKGIAADEQFIKKHGLDNRYAQRFYIHNVSFLSRCYLWTEQYDKALDSAKKINDFSQKLPNKKPEDPEDLFAVLQTYLYFHKWNEIIDSKEPENDYVKPFWHFAKAEAYLALNQIDQAENEQKLFLELKKKDDIYELATFELAAFMEKAKGNTDQSIDLFKQAVDKLDHMYFMKWHYLERQLLGKALLEAGRFQEAEEVFRKALLNMQRNGRSLFGLNEALKAQGKFNYWTQRETDQALKNSESFTLNDL